MRRSHSPTVATLNARSELRRLRMLVGAHGPAAAELDRLEDVLAAALELTEEEAINACEDYIVQNFVDKDDHLKLERELEEAEAERDEVKEAHDKLRKVHEKTKARLLEAEKS
jgi:hypothetical protein